MERDENPEATAPKQCAMVEATGANPKVPAKYPQQKPERYPGNRITGKWLRDRYDL